MSEPVVENLASEIDKCLAEVADDQRKAGYGEFLEIGFQHEGEQDMPIDTSQLRALVEAGAVKQIEVIGTLDSGFKIIVNGNVEIFTQRGKLKVFANANSVIRCLEQAGVNRFVIQIGD